MKKFSLTDLLISVVTAELVGAVSAVIAGDFGGFYSQIVRPPLSPPATVFPIVWAVLYALMGVSAYLVKRKRPDSLKIYIIQLAVNFSWSIVFFRFRLFLLSAIVAAALLILVGVMIMRFCKISRPAAAMNVPYLLWSAFAAYLAAAIYIIN
ncbi:MAG: tryptophan-rich sensory protein [Ruminococcus sp.]|nr:tryptophan-rich sensory protein [Ruminococcus sp.]